MRFCPYDYKCLSINVKLKLIEKEMKPYLDLIITKKVFQQGYLFVVCLYV